MASDKWQISGRMIELCSCKMMCPCFLGPDTVPDNEWCSGAFAYSIETGGAADVDLSGCRLALAADWPGNFFHGDGTGRLYLDARASDAQHKELEAIFTGQRGGVFETVFAAVISTWLPTKTAEIEIEFGDPCTITIGDMASVRLTPQVDGSGNPVELSGSVAQSALQVGAMQLAKCDNVPWSDRISRDWIPDSSTLHKFNWSN